MKNIIVAQSIAELEFIINKLSKINNLYCLPLNLSVQLYCIENKIQFIDPIFYIDNKFHNEAVYSSEKMKKKIKFDKNYKLGEKINIITFLRSYFNSIIYLIEIISKIDKKEKVDKIFVSGWFNYEDTFSSENYYVSFILKSIFKKKIVEITKQNIRLPRFDYKNKYLIKSKKLDSKSKIVILSNVGYNFFRILKYLFSRKEKFLVISPLNQEISNLKKIILKIFRVHFFSFEKLKSKEKILLRLPKVQYKFRKFNITKLLNFRIQQEKNNIFNNILKFNSFELYFRNAKPSIAITNSSRNLDGLILDFAYKNKIPFFCIPHGTISAYFNRFDKIYKKIIAESITYPKSIFISQSKISNWFYNKEKSLYKKNFFTGNILFAEKSSKIKKGNSILYAVTMKDFNNIQFLGVEMYYEYLNNLNNLNNLAKKNNLNIVVKNHPSIKHLTKKLQIIFENLVFSDKKIQILLRDALCTVSYSSSVIEDSLYCKKPVILLDRWNRYKHCKISKKMKSKNPAIQYATDNKKFIKCIEALKQNKKINFNFYIKSENSKNNIKNLFNKFFKI